VEPCPAKKTRFHGASDAANVQRKGHHHPLYTDEYRLVDHHSRLRDGDHDIRAARRGNRGADGHRPLQGSANNIYGPFTYNPCEKLLAERVDWDALQLLSDEQVEEYRKKNVKGQGDTNPECCYLVNNQWVCW
jgi:hypothetical protein